MNEKVTQMVSLLFKDLQMSEEVQALHSEVLNNCQDRFADLVSTGLSEEEALSAVMESLAGMEDVLKDYPRKDEEPDGSVPAAEESPEGPSLFNFTPDQILAVDAQLSACDVEICVSEQEFHLEQHGKVFSRLDPDGTLRLWQEKPSDNLFRGISWEHSFESFESFGDAMSKLGQNISDLVSRGFRTGEQEARILLCLPRTVHPNIQIRTTSGEIDWRDAVPGAEFSLRSTSGDIRVQMEDGFLLPRAEISTTSGDAELHLSAEEAHISSVSGDVSWSGDAGSLEMVSTSGDTEVYGLVRKGSISSTSGDLSLELTEDAPAELELVSVSGDIELRLPSSVRQISAELKSVSGSIRQRGLEITDTAPVSVKASTVSGDLKIYS